MKKRKGVIKPVTKRDFEEWLRMGCALWPQYKPADLRSTFQDILKSPKQTAFLCVSPDGRPIGFANISMRVDYVEGSHSSPVGYLEGIFVEREYRKQGIGKRLLEAGERWAAGKGAMEMGSDAEFKNLKSHEFHRAVGFKQSYKIVHYIKKIKKAPHKDETL